MVSPPAAAPLQLRRRWPQTPVLLALGACIVMLQVRLSRRRHSLPLMVAVLALCQRGATFAVGPVFRQHRLEGARY